MKTRTITTDAIKNKLSSDFQKYLGIGDVRVNDLLKSAKLQDKAYELSCLIKVMEELKSFRNSLSFTLINGTSLVFRASGGAIQRNVWPYIEISDGINAVGELWVDIEFLAYSADSQNAAIKGQLYGKCHELDVVLVPPGTSGFPSYEDLYLGVEAKHCPYSKRLLKELLGVRREMGLLSPHNNYDAPIWFIWWDKSLPAFPPSALISMCSSNTITRYSYPAAFWGIKMEHHPL